MSLLTLSPARTVVRRACWASTSYRSAQPGAALASRAGSRLDLDRAEAWIRHLHLKGAPAERVLNGLQSPGPTTPISLLEKNWRSYRKS
jgi:hypothetical protein